MNKNKMKLTKKDHEALKPLDDLYRKMHSDGAKMLENASMEELQNIFEAMSKTGTTNCAWTEYYVSKNFLPIIKDVLIIRAALEGEFIRKSI